MLVDSRRQGVRGSWIVAVVNITGGQIRAHGYHTIIHYFLELEIRKVSYGSEKSNNVVLGWQRRS
jgi:hypothetical protein